MHSLGPTAAVSVFHVVETKATDAVTRRIEGGQFLDPGRGRAAFPWDGACGSGENQADPQDIVISPLAPLPLRGADPDEVVDETLKANTRILLHLVEPVNHETRRIVDRNLESLALFADHVLLALAIAEGPASPPDWIRSADEGEFPHHSNQRGARKQDTTIGKGSNRIPARTIHFGKSFQNLGAFLLRVPEEPVELTAHE